MKLIGKPVLQSVDCSTAYEEQPHYHGGCELKEGNLLYSLLWLASKGWPIVAAPRVSFMQPPSRILNILHIEMKIDPRGCKKNIRISTGFEPVTSRHRCDALTN